jgi:hypothetical protein
MHHFMRTEHASGETLKFEQAMISVLLLTLESVLLLLLEYLRKIGRNPLQVHNI